MTYHSEERGIPAEPLAPGLNPGGLLATVRYRDGREVGPVALSWDSDLEHLAAVHAEQAATSGSVVIIHDGDTGEPVAVLGFVGRG